MSATSAVILVARRELTLARRSRGFWSLLGLLAAVAWLPPLLLPLRAGALGFARFDESALLALALGAVILPVVSLLAGTDLFAGEMEDGTLVSVVTLPISRGACFAGKYLGRTAAIACAYLLAFASAGIATAAARGTGGAGAFVAVGLGGLLLCLACMGIGTALGASGHGRVRSLGAALLAWLVLVFAIDAVLLAVVVALAPPPPEEVGAHGHSELHAPLANEPSGGHDPWAEGGEASNSRVGRSLPWLMALDPVDLYRLVALEGSPQLRDRFATGVPGAAAAGVWLPILIGWLVWLAVPPLVGLRRFRRAVLR
jgi:Cu-processing system permease protein